MKLTLLGSIVSNLLLVLGSAFIAGGFMHQMQHFNQKGINVNCGLLILSGACVMPHAFVMRLMAVMLRHAAEW